MKGVAPARKAAFEVLLAIERDQKRSDGLLYHASISKLSAADRNLATNLVLGTLRWQSALDETINARLTRPRAVLDAGIRVAMRLGVFQLLYLDRIPAYAAIGESVELAKKSGNRFAAGMVNAVLRKIAAEVEQKETVNVTDPSRLARVYAHPQWIVERWVRHFGFEGAKAICQYNQLPAPVYVRLCTQDAECRLLEEGLGVAPGKFLQSVCRIVSGDVTSSKAFRDGVVRIQDEGSQLIAELAGKGRRILDACAAPGGKTAILAERNPDAQILACDVSRKRLAQMQMLFASDPRLKHLRYRVIDAAMHDRSAEYDLVLCDAPCSGTGTLGRNPEIRHRLTEAELLRQRDRQIEILSSLLHCVKRGGRLLYSTCSLEPEENENVITECLKRNPDFQLVSLEQEIDRLDQAGILRPGAADTLKSTALSGGCLQTLPGTHDCDGFFAAMLVNGRP
jgi:16S rRNA (cytosine967-C5)-methyltransferase